MRLARCNAIYDALKRRGQESKEVDQKRYHRKRSDGADKMHVVVLWRGAGSYPLDRSTLEVMSKHDMSLTLRWRPRSPAGAPQLIQGRPRTGGLRRRGHDHEARLPLRAH
jgi:hypothetical protein